MISGRLSARVAFDLSLKTIRVQSKCTSRRKEGIARARAQKPERASNDKRPTGNFEVKTEEAMSLRR